MTTASVERTLGSPVRRRSVVGGVTYLEYDVGRYGDGSGDTFIVKLIGGQVVDAAMPSGSLDGVHPPDYPPGPFWRSAVLRDFALAQTDLPPRAAGSLNVC